LRLGAGDGDARSAVEQWERMFGIPVSKDELAFTNASMGFVRGQEGQPEGLLSITIGVEGRTRMQGIVDRARAAGLWKDGWFEMVGVRWYLMLMEDVNPHI